ncbi:MAG: DUF2089 domain-containing protein [Candidatus Binataceae bacterium]
MGRLVLKCPSCSGSLSIARLSCPSCTINIEGDFGVPALLKLTSAQLDFIEVFIKNRGVIRDVERELGVSYPTVRARLDEVVEALGYQSRSGAADEGTRDTPASRRRAVLAQVRAGRISPEQALTALRQVTERRK